MKLSRDTCRDGGFATTTFAICVCEDWHGLTRRAGKSLLGRFEHQYVCWAI